MATTIVPSTTSSIISIVIMIIIMFLLVWFGIWYYERSTGKRAAFIEQTKELTGNSPKIQTPQKLDSGERISKFF